MNRNMNVVTMNKAYLTCEALPKITLFNNIVLLVALDRCYLEGIIFCDCAWRWNLVYKKNLQTFSTLFIGLFESFFSVENNSFFP